MLVDIKHKRDDSEVARISGGEGRVPTTAAQGALMKSNDSKMAALQVGHIVCFLGGKDDRREAIIVNHISRYEGEVNALTVCTYVTFGGVPARQYDVELNDWRVVPEDTFRGYSVRDGQILLSFPRRPPNQKLLARVDRLLYWAPRLLVLQDRRAERKLERRRLLKQYADEACAEFCPDPQHADLELVATQAA